MSGPPRPARVIAVFPTALYLAIDDLSRALAMPVLPVVAHGGLRLPTAVTLATEEAGGDWGVREGASVVVGGGRIELPGAVVAGVRTWRPRRMPSAGSALLQRAAPGLGDLPRGPLADEVRALVGDLVRHRDPAPRVRALVGAGPGLTPSGDDALCGVLLALRLRGPRAEVLRRTLWEVVRPRLAATTSLSASLLAEAAQGYAVPPMVHLGEALVAGSPHEVRARAAQVAAIGHTSGADLLAGLVGCLDAVAAQAEPVAVGQRLELVDVLRSNP